MEAVYAIAFLIELGRIAMESEKDNQPRNGDDKSSAEFSKETDEINESLKKFESLYINHQHEELISLGVNLINSILSSENSAFVGTLDLIYLTMGEAFLSLAEYDQSTVFNGFVTGILKKDAIINESYCYFFQKDYLAALSKIQLAADLNPDNLMLHYLKGACFWLSGLKEEGALIFREAVELDKPNGFSLGGDVYGYFVRGLVMKWLNRRHDAMKDFDFCIYFAKRYANEPLKKMAIAQFSKVRNQFPKMKDFLK